MSLTISLTGLPEMRARLSDMAERMAVASKTAVHAEAEDVLRVAVDRYVPRDTGNLADSGVVIDSPDGAISSSVQFGAGKSLAYALAIHENPSGHDPRSWRVHQERGQKVTFSMGGPKYLSTPLFAAVAGMADRLGARITEGIE